MPALKGWTLCIDEPDCDCAICVQLPGWAGGLGERERVYLALYIAARHVMDYRLTAAMHLYSVRSRVALRPELLVKALREARVASKIQRALEDTSPYAWEAVLYKGIVYAEQILSLDKLAVVKVKPPKDKREQERLRALLESRRVTAKDKNYRVGGLADELRAESLAPWVYLVPRRSLPELRRILEEYGGGIEIIYDPTAP